MGLLVALVLFLVPVTSSLPCYEPPVDAAIVRSFEAPSCPYCAGHRGVEYRVTVGTPLRAVAAGRVSFIGPVAHVNYLVIEQADGRRATYGMWTNSPLRRGDRVVSGQVVAASSTSVYFGLRVGEVYIDPTPMLGVRRLQVRLVPIDRTSARPARRGSLQCPSGGAT